MTEQKLFFKLGKYYCKISEFNCTPTMNAKKLCESKASLVESARRRESVNVKIRGGGVGGVGVGRWLVINRNL